MVKFNKKILKEITKDVVSGYIEDLVDFSWTSLAELGVEEIEIIEDSYGDKWIVDAQINEGSYETIWEDISNSISEDYDIDIYEWCEKKDIDLDQIISDMIDYIVEEDDKLCLVSKGWVDYLGVLYESYDEICKERENVEEFNEYMYADIKNGIYDCVENTKEFGDVTGELDFVFSDFDYSFDCETEWIKYAKEHFNLEYNDAMDLYNKYKDEFITVDDMEEYIENLADESDDFDIDDNSCGKCLIWVENPYYESIDDEEAA